MEISSIVFLEKKSNNSLSQKNNRSKFIIDNSFVYFCRLFTVLLVTVIVNNHGDDNIFTIQSVCCSRYPATSVSKEILGRLGTNRLVFQEEDC